MPLGGLPILSDDQNSKRGGTRESAKCNRPEGPRENPTARDAEEEDADGDEYTIDRLVAYDAELNRTRTPWFGFGPNDDLWHARNSAPQQVSFVFQETKRRSTPEGH